MTIKGLQEALAAHLRMIRELKPSGALGRAVKEMLIRAHRRAAIYTHVDTGALRASHRIRIDGGGLVGRVYLDQSARNPRTGERTATYGLHEHRRGGRHAFYAQVEKRDGPMIGRAGGHAFAKGLKAGMGI